MILKQVTEMNIRDDSAGEGHFGAPRGTRSHVGEDSLCTPGAGILSPCNGTVTKHGYCYNGDFKYRYVEITEQCGLRHRLFYVLPCWQLLDACTVNDVVGIAQDISERYPGKGMKPHVHYEIKDQTGAYVDPEDYG